MDQAAPADLLKGLEHAIVKAAEMTEPRTLPPELGTDRQQVQRMQLAGVAGALTLAGNLDLDCDRLAAGPVQTKAKKPQLAGELTEFSMTFQTRPLRTPSRSTIATTYTVASSMATPTTTRNRPTSKPVSAVAMNV